MKWYEWVMFGSLVVTFGLLLINYIWIMVLEWKGLDNRDPLPHSYFEDLK